MNKKGQTAFETLFLAVVVISSAILIVSLYTSISDDTIALSTARAETTRQLSMMTENIQIEKISLQKSGLSATINIDLTKATALNETEIQNKIKSATKFTDVTITIS